MTAYSLQMKKYVSDDLCFNFVNEHNNCKYFILISTNYNLLNIANDI